MLWSQTAHSIRWLRRGRRGPFRWMLRHAAGLCSHDAYACRHRRRQACTCSRSQNFEPIQSSRLTLHCQGGYSLSSIAESALSCTRVLLGEAPEPYEHGLRPSAAAMETVHEVCLQQSPFWHCIHPDLVTWPQGLLPDLHQYPGPDVSIEGYRGSTQSMIGALRSGPHCTALILPDVLKSHRLEKVMSQHPDFFELPLADPVLQARFGKQILATSDKCCTVEHDLLTFPVGLTYTPPQLWCYLFTICELNSFETVRIS